MTQLETCYHKLEVLKEYMAIKITGWWGMEVWMNLQVCPDEYYIRKGEPLPIPYMVTIKTPTFEEFYNHKTTAL